MDEIKELIEKAVKMLQEDDALMANFRKEPIKVVEKLLKVDLPDDKIEAIVKNVYRGSGVVFAPAAKKEIAKLASLGFDNLPVCMAKTQYSFSDDAAKLGAPENFTVTVRNVKVSAGAGFIVALTGDIMTMPGLPKSPAALRIDVDEDGKISGLF